MLRAGVCAYRVIGVKNINGWKSEDLGEGPICVYACDCCVNQSMRSEAPTSERKMGQRASVEVAELTEGVIDPSQNVSKESEQKESEMSPVRWALSLKETSAMPSKGEEPTVPVTPAKETAKSIAGGCPSPEISTTPKMTIADERFLKGLAESMKKIQKINQRTAEDLCRTEEMLESIRRAREAEEAESGARSAARRVPGVELTKPCEELPR